VRPTACIYLEHHSYNGAGAEVLDKPREEFPACEVSIVLGSELFIGPDELHCNQLVPLLLEARDHLSHQSSLNCVGLAREEGALMLSPAGKECKKICS
jgi:hypothetical protein